ncbi:MAG: gliding motility-associated C-terminal domain-containing protein, partial [Chitinophagaceae bacterium]|nr:gliding motility-associated C-terminal domain-containing protein [Chitinophagaceae bacterium]
RDIAVAVDDAGGVYVTGGYDHTRPFGNTTLTCTGGYDIFVMKYDDAGNFIWAKSGGSKKDDWSSGICSDKNGFIYIAGEHRDSLIMDTVIMKNYDKRDAFIMKLDASNGRPVWSKRAGSDLGGERANDVFADENCNIYVCGDINDGAKFGDKIIVPSGKSVEAFVAKITPEGKWSWVITGGGVDSNDRCNAITRGKGNQLYACGFYRAPATFGTNGPLISAGKSDAWFARIHDSSINKNQLFSFTRPTDTIFCIEGTVKLPIQDHAHLEFAPSSGVSANANESELTFYANTTTTYTVTGYSKGLCPEYDTLIFTIIIGQKPDAEFVVNPTETFVDNPIFNLQNTSTGAVSYEWYYLNALFSSAQHEQKKFDTAGKYCFTLVATSQYNCKDTATHCGDIFKLEDYFVPNVFTPNNDQLNDVFMPVFVNMIIADIRNYSFTIVDRFGHQVFHTNDPSKGWDGNIKDVRWPDIGTYFYHLKYTSGQGKKIEKKGDVVLMR